MLDKSVKTIPDGTGLVPHSKPEAGNAQHKLCRRYVQKKRHPKNMGCKGNCLDNAYRDNKLLGSFKSDLLYLKAIGSDGIFHTSWWVIRVITIAAVSRQSGRACRLSFAGSKPFRWTGQDGLDVMEQRFLALWTLTPGSSLFHFDFPIFRLNPWSEGAQRRYAGFSRQARYETGQGFRRISVSPPKGNGTISVPRIKQTLFGQTQCSVADIRVSIPPFSGA